MIISASRRTDIPAYHSDWFMNRVKSGYLYVRNPMNFNQISKIALNPYDVECIVFWTKNPQPMFKYLCDLEAYNYYFQFTLTSYNQKIETNLPSKKFLVPVFKALSKRIGKARVIWRYDPILLSDEIDLDYHVRNFELLAGKLEGYTEKCVISFLDEYSKIKKALRDNNIRLLSLDEIDHLAREFSLIAQKHNMILETCSEGVALEVYGINHGKCIDDQLISRVFDLNGSVVKDRNQRDNCGCVKSIDIGAYNTCLNGCVYCYATYNNMISLTDNVDNPLLSGEINENSKIYDRKIEKLFSREFDLEDLVK